MNNYLVKILQLIIDNNGLINEEILLENLEISKSVLNYHLSNLNIFLENAGVSKVERSNNNLSIRKKDIAKIKKSIIDAEYVFNSKERQDIITILIGISKENLSIGYFVDLFKVAKNTIVEDIKNIRDELKEITLEYNKAQGYYFNGDELLIRYTIFRTLHNNDNIVINKIKTNIIDDLLYKECNIKKASKIVRQILIDNEEKSNKRFIYFSLDSLAKTIIVSFLRSKKNNVSFNEKIDINEDNFKFIENELAKNNINFFDNELIYLYLIIQSAKISYSEKPSKNETIIKLQNEITEELERIYFINMKDYDSYNMFLLHIESMYYRAKYRIKVANFEYKQNSLKEDYVFSRIVEKISKDFNLFIDDEEKVLLNFYFKVLTNSNNKYESNKKIIVLCASGLGSSAYVKYQLENLFNNTFNFEISDIASLYDKIDENTLLVLSTISMEPPKDIVKMNIDWMVVPVILGNYDKQKLLDWSLTKPVDNRIQTLNNIIQIIDSSSVITDKNKLYKQLGNYLFKENKEINYHLKDLINEKYINYFDSASCIEEAIKLSCIDAVNDGVLKQEYVDDVINNINEYGPYCECLNGILVPHAIPKSNVKMPLFSIGIFKNEIYVEKWNKSIKAIFVLGVVDTTSHIDAFAELLSFLSENDTYQTLDKYKDTKKLYKEMSEYDGQ